MYGNCNCNSCPNGCFNNIDYEKNYQNVIANNMNDDRVYRRFGRFGRFGGIGFGGFGVPFILGAATGAAIARPYSYYPYPYNPYYPPYYY